MDGTQALPLSLCLRIFPPNQANNKLPFSKLKASSRSPSIRLQPRKKHHHHNHNNNENKNKKPEPFQENDAFPASLPLHSKNPHAICRDIQRFARGNKLKEALAIMDYMDQQGFPVNVTTFNALIAACVRTKSLNEGKQIHAHMRINGLENSEYLRTKLVHMYTSCGSLEDADKVFDESTSGSVYSWNALLRGTVIAGRRRYRDVLANYLKMRELGVELNVYTFSCVLKSFGGASAFTQGLKTHALLIKNGFVDYAILRTCLIDMYFKCGKIKLACRVFEETDERDVVVWGAMIAGFAHNRLKMEAMHYVRWMINEGIYPNSVVLTMILPVIGEVGAWKLGREVHAYVLKRRRYAKDQFIQSGLVDMYCKCGDMSSGRQAFYGSVERNVIMWTALMSGYVSNGRLEQALRSVVWMQQEGSRPDVVTIATVLPSLCPCGVLEYSHKLFDTMEERNVISWTAMIDSYVDNGCPHEALGVFRSMQLSRHRPDSVAMARVLSVCAENIKMYGMCGFIESAKLVFDSVPIKGSITWTAIIEAYGYNDLSRDAIDLFNDMRHGGFAPNHFTFKAVLSICNQAGSADEACQIFNLMSRKYKIKASKEHYTIMIELLTRFGRVEEAQRFIQMSSSLS
ncbi:hypothetical protein JRO89_XS07G0275300 [Xanthoceras sorbifolium]|uniref:Pentatricopeptide repeat-containing protein n=1 Tax=Xanthoceras sorbifolium TaxID=99658 RepID=A0ABQ8HVD3_9ROSI|nr:hypothetical protein JRO89_XS07G0275300 [Xanthoceras sorbifolium]